MERKRKIMDKPIDKDALLDKMLGQPGAARKLRRAYQALRSQRRGTGVTRYKGLNSGADLFWHGIVHQPDVPTWFTASKAVQGEIEVTCPFCNAELTVDAADLDPDQPVVGCPSCGHEFELDEGTDAGDEGDENADPFQFSKIMPPGQKRGIYEPSELINRAITKRPGTFPTGAVGPRDSKALQPGVAADPFWTGGRAPGGFERWPITTDRPRQDTPQQSRLGNANRIGDYSPAPKPSRLLTNTSKALSDLLVGEDTDDGDDPFFGCGTAFDPTGRR